MQIQIKNLTGRYIVINSIKQKLAPKATMILAVAGELADDDILQLERLGCVEISKINHKIKTAKPGKPAPKPGKTVAKPQTSINDQLGSEVTVMVPNKDGKCSARKGKMVNLASGVAAQAKAKEIEEEATVSTRQTKNMKRAERLRALAQGRNPDADADPDVAFIDHK